VESGCAYAFNGRVATVRPAAIPGAALHCRLQMQPCVVARQGTGACLAAARYHCIVSMTHLQLGEPPDWVWVSISDICVTRLCSTDGSVRQLSNQRSGQC